ncbi:hypothetical protein EVAR_10978_1 [Eumeta japonica]|uniref:Uncharacterized protein n=1 Tax=Eumeta variegata TaxID=151549 RepID=A0A4C1U668_EUMVA|nr:hypothetical protein EVAR_10978_1 [Eumeta japonica]
MSKEGSRLVLGLGWEFTGTGSDFDNGIRINNENRTEVGNDIDTEIEIFKGGNCESIKSNLSKKSKTVLDLNRQDDNLIRDLAENGFRDRLLDLSAAAASLELLE